MISYKQSNGLSEQKEVEGNVLILKSFGRAARVKDQKISLNLPQKRRRRNKISNVPVSKILDRFKLGETVIVINKDVANYNMIGEVWKVTNYDDDPKISVSFDGHIYRYRPEDLVIT